MHVSGRHRGRRVAEIRLFGSGRGSPIAPTRCSRDVQAPRTALLARDLTRERDTAAAHLGRPGRTRRLRDANKCGPANDAAPCREQGLPLGDRGPSRARASSRGIDAQRLRRRDHLEPSGPRGAGGHPEGAVHSGDAERDRPGTPRRRRSKVPTAEELHATHLGPASGPAPPLVMASGEESALARLPEEAVAAPVELMASALVDSDR